jgi:hypothetical protein
MQHVWGDDKCVQNLLVSPKGEKTLEGPGHRWEDNIKMDLRETVGGCRLDSSGSV